MDLTSELVERKAREYRDTAPLYAVEREHVEMLPDMLASGDFGWRDPEWVVQWYFRRHLGAYPDRARREAEAAYDENDYEDVADALRGAFDAETIADRLDSLTDLTGVDVPLASAFLQFALPDRYVAVSEREWAALREADELDDPYPDPFTPADYETFVDAVRSVADRCDCDLYTLYQALWQLGEETD